MGPEESWQLIAAHRLAIADLLDPLTSEEWEQPSLCAGWRVRDVAAHLALGTSALPLRTMIREGVRARGNFDRLNHDLGVRYARRPTRALASELRQRAASREIPAVTNYRNLLFDVLVHGQDIAIPLRKPLSFPAAAGAAAADNLWRLGWPWWTQRRHRGLSFMATDTAWAVGSGAEVRGPVRALLLALAGRPAALPELSGEGLPELSRRLVTASST